MSTSGIESGRKGMARTGLAYVYVSVFLALFGAVYEYFSHGVFSYYMAYAFGFTLAGGALPFFHIAFSRAHLPGRACLNLYHAGIATLSAGSLFQGALEIYGTTNRLTCVYWIVGTALLLIAVALWALDARGNHARPRR